MNYVAIHDQQCGTVVENILLAWRCGGGTRRLATGVLPEPDDAFNPVGLRIVGSPPGWLSILTNSL